MSVVSEKSPNNPLDNLSVSTKISLGAGLILFFLIVVSAVSYFSLSSADSNFNTYRGYARETNQFGRIQANLLVARLNAKDYILKNTEEVAEQVSSRIETMQEIIEESKSIINGDDQLALVDAAGNEAQAYYDAFTEVRALVQQRNELVDRLNATGPQIEKDLTAIMSSANEDADPAASYVAGMALRSLLLARLYTNRFLVDNLEASNARVNSEMKLFDEMKDRLLTELQNPTRRELAAKVREGADIYKKTFLEVVNVINTRNDIITNRMDVIGPRLANAVEEAKLNNKALQDDLGPRATEEVYQANLINRIVAFVAIIIGVALAWLTAKATSGPIIRMTSAMGDLAEGNLDVDIPARGRKDEIGKMADAVQTFKDAAIAKRAMEEKENNREKLEEERLAREAEKEEQAKQVKFVVSSMARGLNQFAEGDLTVQLEEEFAEEFDALRVDFNNSILQINQTLLKIRTGAQSIDVKSGAIRDSADSLSRRTENQAASLEETSAALEEITATVGETSAQATEASEVAQKAQTDTDESSDVVSKAISAMERIENASSEISTIISVIDEIAFQTNLLALNAGVEAARAGEAGSGFAVVAQEVRELAQRSAGAAKEIAELITKSNTEVKSGVDLVRETGKSLEKISEHVSNMNFKMASISTASDEQLLGIQEVNTAVADMDQMTQQNAAMVEESTAVTNELATEVTLLTNMINQFRLDNMQSSAAQQQAA